MKPVHRSKVDKRQSAGKFRHDVSRTHGKNLVQAPMRGGWRL